MTRMNRTPPPQTFTDEGEYEFHLGEARQGEHTGKGAYIIMPPGKGSPPPQPIQRARLKEDLYACSDADAVILRVDLDGNLVDGAPIVVSDVMSVVGNILSATSDENGELRIPAGTCLYTYYFADDMSYEPIGEMGLCCLEGGGSGGSEGSGSGSGPQPIPKECGVPCPDSLCSSGSMGSSSGPVDCFVLTYCCNAGMSWSPVGTADDSFVPYIGADKTVDLNTQTLKAKSVDTNDGVNTVTLCDGTNAINATGPMIFGNTAGQGIMIGDVNGPAAATDASKGAIAIGGKTEAYDGGNGAIAIGDVAAAKDQGGGAIAIGYSTVASDDGSGAVAIGPNAQAYDGGDGSGAFALGPNAIAYASPGGVAIAIGPNAQAYDGGNGAIALGNVTAGDGQITIGLKNSGFLRMNSAIALFYVPIRPITRPTTSAPAYHKGAIYFDTTLNKLCVGGATGWETISSGGVI